MECTKPALRLRGPLAARTAVLVGHSQTVLDLRPPATTPPQVLRHSLPPVEHEACFFHVQLLKCLTSYSDCISVNGKHLVPSSLCFQALVILLTLFSVEEAPEPSPSLLCQGQKRPYAFAGL